MPELLPAPLPDGNYISIVIPVYRNADTLVELHRRLNAIFETMAFKLEIIFVDDACPEESLVVIQQIAETDTRVKAIALARNIGQQRAIMLGLRYARGQFVIILDADLQDPPEAIPDLLQRIGQGYEAVFAGRRGQYEAQSRLLSSRLFKGLLHILTGIPPDAGIYVVITRKMLVALLGLHESQPYVVGMIGCTDLPITSIPVVRSNRLHGESAYNSFDRLHIGLQAIFRVLILKLRPPKPYPSASTWPYEVSIKTYVGINFPPSNSS